MRADARRNHDRLLAEARTVFEEQGAQASLELVARRAGVAIGTLYAHFPTRRALLGALLRERQDDVFALGDTLLTDQDPGAALASWMRAVTAHAAVYSGLADQLLGSLDDTSSELYGACKRMGAAGEALLGRAKAAGAVRQDVTADDVFALISAAAWLRDQLPPDRADRQLGLMIDGIAATAPARD